MSAKLAPIGRKSITYSSFYSDPKFVITPTPEFRVTPFVAFCRFAMLANQSVLTKAPTSPATACTSVGLSRSSAQSSSRYD
jgi:hypothetical protein